jgi:hypothetical protein
MRKIKADWGAGGRGLRKKKWGNGGYCISARGLRAAGRTQEMKLDVSYIPQGQGTVKEYL